MAKLKEEKFTNEHGVEMIREFFGKDENHISATVEKPVQTEIEEQTNEEPISQDKLNAEMLLNQATILENQSAQDEVLAEILLNQVGGETNV